MDLMIKKKDMNSRNVLKSIERKTNFFKEFDTALKRDNDSPILSNGYKLEGIVIKHNSHYTPIGVVTNSIDTILEE